MGDFPGHPVAKTRHFHCWGYVFNPVWGTKIPASCMAWPKESLQGNSSRYFYSRRTYPTHCPLRVTELISLPWIQQFTAKVLSIFFFKGEWYIEVKKLARHTYLLPKINFVSRLQSTLSNDCSMVITQFSTYNFKYFEFMQQN